MIDSASLDFSLVAKAGLTQSEFAALVGANRISVNHWVNKRRTPHRHLAPRVKKALQLIARAVEAGRLPGAIPGTGARTRKERIGYIRDALAH